MGSGFVWSEDVESQLDYSFQQGPSSEIGV